MTDRGRKDAGEKITDASIFAPAPAATENIRRLSFGDQLFSYKVSSFFGKLHLFSLRRW